MRCVLLPVLGGFPQFTFVNRFLVEDIFNCYLEEMNEDSTAVRDCHLFSGIRC